MQSVHSHCAIFVLARVFVDATFGLVRVFMCNGGKWVDDGFDVIICILINVCVHDHMNLYVNLG